MRNVTTLLFDLGGVLVELGPVDEMLASHRYEPGEIWQRWIHSDAVRRFESGASTAEEFAAHMVNEFHLIHEESEFLQHFANWPKRTFAGAENLLDELAEHYQLLCLSNTNLLHYEAFLSKQTILSRFQKSWFSHVTGHLKPETQSFAQVIDEYRLNPQDVLFLDDNPGNVKAARQFGLNAERVDAPNGVRHALERLGLST